MEEVFRDVVGYESLYQVSNLGRVFSKNRLIGNRRCMAKELCQKPNEDGYLKVGLRDDNGHIKYCFVHRLVAQAFISEVDGKPLVNHIDGCKTHNYASNLEWVTLDENLKHAAAHGLMQHGEDRPDAKLTTTQVLEIYTYIGILSSREVGEKFGISKNTALLIMKGKKWKHLYNTVFNS